MKRIILFLCVFTCFMNGYSQNPVDLSVQLLPTIVKNNPCSIRFRWEPISQISQIKIFRKTPEYASFDNSTLVATLAPTDTAFADINIVEGNIYDYNIRVINMAGLTSAQTYLQCAVNKPRVNYRGKLILLIDSLMSVPLANEISRLCDDLEGDGWTVKKHTVLRTESPSFVKSMILNEYNADKLNVKSVFLLGHVPVPYSGNQNPDGHPDHMGAWPCDGYYADMTGVWTDVNVNNTTATDVRNINIPGDGKFDQLYLLATLELEIGRVDFFNMPAFAKDEIQLLKMYLDKNHNFRHKIFSVQQKALVDDSFGYFNGESFATSGWSSFAAMFPKSDIVAGDFSSLTSEANNSYLWSYGCGPGNFSTCMGVSQTALLATSEPHSVFNLMFGSYFGDWDVQNNYMRALLASAGWGLTCSWSGRPYNVMHPMALGETIGKCMLLTMKNSGTYLSNMFYKSVVLGLMGDPTLRMHVVDPPSNVVAIKTNEGCKISWKNSNDNVKGYLVYKRNPLTNNFIELNSTILTDTTFTDIYQSDEMPVYMVKSVKTEKSNSGSYENLSQGISAKTTLDTAIPVKNENNNLFSIVPQLVVDYQFELIFKCDIHNADVEIANIEGLIINTLNISGKVTNIKLPTNITPGCYFVSVKYNGTKLTKRIIIQ